MDTLKDPSVIVMLSATKLKVPVIEPGSLLVMAISPDVA
jgi:hypothetical protein